MSETGSVLWTLQAQDEDGDDIIIRFPDYETESKHLVIIMQKTSTNGVAAADIILNHTLDRDYVNIHCFKSLEFSFTGITSCTGES